MKKIVSLSLIVIMLLSVSLFATDREIITVYVNGEIVQSDTPAVLVGGSTMLPFRAILNALGVTDDQITWDEKSQSVEVNPDGLYIFLTIDVPAAIVNNDMVSLNTAPYIENSRTMIPVRFISESLGANVVWEASTKTVYITQ